MKTFEITFKGINGKVSTRYEAKTRKEALQKALNDGAIVIDEINFEGGVA